MTNLKFDKLDIPVLVSHLISDGVKVIRANLPIIPDNLQIIGNEIQNKIRNNLIYISLNFSLRFFEIPNTAKLNFSDKLKNNIIKQINKYEKHK